ncbi:MAG: hypothetical protein SFU98_06260 [Leptospiraceae bacterium]|nr:hypothetical protein [Leptospiraceae bacterium]
MKRIYVEYKSNQEQKDKHWFNNYTGNVFNIVFGILPNYSSIQWSDKEKANTAIDELKYQLNRDKIDFGKELAKLTKIDIHITYEAEVNKDKLKLTFHFGYPPDFKIQDSIVVEGREENFANFQQELLDKLFLKLQINNDELKKQIQEKILFSNANEAKEFPEDLDESDSKKLCENLLKSQSKYPNNIPVVFYTARCSKLFANNREEYLKEIFTLKKTLEERHWDRIFFYYSILDDISKTYVLINQKENALKFRLEQLEKMKLANLDQTETYAVYLRELAGLYSIENEEVKAKETLLQVKDLQERIGMEDSVSFADTITRLSNIELANKNLDKAKSYLVKAKKIYRDVNLHQTSVFSDVAFKLGRVYHLEEKDKEAIQEYEEALLVWHVQDRTSEETISIYWYLSQIHSKLGNKEKAISLSKQAFYYLDDLGFTYSQTYADLLFEIGKEISNQSFLEKANRIYKVIGKENSIENAKVLFALGEITKSLEKVEEGLDILKSLKLEESKEFADGLINKGFILHRIGFGKEGLENLENAKFLYEKLGLEKSKEYLYVLNILKDAFPVNGQYEKGIEIARLFLSHLDKQSVLDWETKIRVLHVLGYTYSLQGVYDLAINCFLESNKVSEKYGNGKSNVMYGLNLYSIADIKSKEGKYEDAINLYKQAITLYQKGKEDIYNERLAKIGIANVFFKMGNFSEAIRYQKKANVLAQSLASSWDQNFYSKEYAIGLMEVGNYYFLWNKWDDALKYYLEAEKIALKYNALEILTMVQYKIGSVYRMKNDLLNAKRYLELAEKNGIKNNDDRSIQIKKATVLKEDKKPEDALVIFQKVSKEKEAYWQTDQSYIETQFQMGLIQEELGKWEQALKHFQISSDYRNRLGLELSEEQRLTYKKIATIYKNHLKEPCKAAKYFQDSLEITEILKSPELEKEKIVLAEIKQECKK